MTTTALPPELDAYLQRFAMRRRRLALARRLGLCVSVAAIFFLLACMADRLWRLSADVRLGLFVCTGAILLLPVIVPLLALLRRVNYVATAARVERASGRFDQRLLTLVSQYEMRPDERGSPEFLFHLLGEVRDEMSRARVGRLLPWTQVAGPWFLAALVTGLWCVTWRAPWLGLPQLVTRLAVPMRNTPPVSMTRVVVFPTDPRVIQGDPVTVNATIRPPDALDVTFRVAGPGQSSTPMTRIGPLGSYSITLPAVDQSFSFNVSAGDAVSPPCAVTVLHRPAVSDLRVRYVYPDYARRAPLTTTGRDGLIEAPVGTRATVQIVSTEPLRSGVLTSPAGRVDLHATADPKVVQTDLPMTSDQAFQIELTSDQGVPARAGVRLLVRPVADRAPLVRLVQPVDDLRIDPHAVLPVWYEAADDIGVTAVTAHVRINNAVTKDVPIPVSGDGRQIDVTYDLDLAPLDLKVGDLVAISVTATDGLKQSAASEERHILITPRTIDIATYQRLSELKRASQAATALAESLEAGTRLMDAADAAGVLRQSIIRAIGRSDSPELSTTLAEFADEAAVCAAAVGTGSGSTVALAAARDLQTRLAVLSAGQQAAATLADRSNLRSAATLPTTQSTAARVKRTLDRARADVTAAAVSLGMDPNAPDLDAKLQQLVDTSVAMAKSRSVVDFVPAATAWAVNGGGGFADRLDVAAAAETARPDANPNRLVDLQLAAKAVRATDESFASNATTRPIALEARQQMAGAIAALQAERASPHPLAKVVDAAAEARTRLRRYAGEADVLLAAAEAINRQAAEGDVKVVATSVTSDDPGSAIRQVQEALAAMPGDLSRLLQAADASRTASQRAAELRRGATTVPVERQPIARRLADQAESAQAGARETLSSAAKSLDPAAAGSLSLRLQHVSPEVASAAGGIDTRLSPALRLLQEAVASADPDSLDAAANLTRQAIGRVQADLRQAQTNLADRDPAKWFGRPGALERLSLTEPGVVPLPVVRGAEPAGYEEALEAYFKRVAKLGGPTTRGKTD